MTALRSEARKALSVRSTAATVVGAAAVTVLGAVATVSSAAPDDLVGPLHGLTFYEIAAVNLSVFSLVIGARVIADEFHHGTVVWTFLFAPSRARVLAAKFAVGAAIAGFSALVGIAAAGAVALAMAGAKNGGVELTGGDLVHAGRLIVVAGGWAAVGCAGGALVRHATGATVAAVVWVLVVENVLAVPLGPLANALPGQAGLVAAGAIETSMPAAAGGLVLALWAGVLGMTAASRLVRQPVFAAG